MQEEPARGKSTLALENPRIRVAIRAGQSYIAPQAALAQLVRALDCGSRGPPFEPGRRYHPKTEIKMPLPWPAPLVFRGSANATPLRSGQGQSPQPTSPDNPPLCHRVYRQARRPKIRRPDG